MRLNEISYKPKDINLQNPAGSIAAIQEFIEANCQPWLKESKGKYVYRGLNKNVYAHMQVFTRNVRQNRKPRDSTEMMQNFFNTIIGIAGGIANRTNSMFVYGSPMPTSSYGHTFYVFPIGDFNYTWSTVWHDWYNDRVAFYSEYETIRDPYNANGKEFAKAVAQVKKDIIVDRNLPKAIASGREIMISCKKALYVNKSDYYLGQHW